MSAITLDSHDTLGKLTIVKNYLSVVKEDTTLPPKTIEYINHAFTATEALIALIKEKTTHTP